MLSRESRVRNYQSIGVKLCEKWRTKNKSAMNSRPGYIDALNHFLRLSTRLQFMVRRKGTTFSQSSHQPSTERQRRIRFFCWSRTCTAVLESRKIKPKLRNRVECPRPKPMRTVLGIHGKVGGETAPHHSYGCRICDMSLGQRPRPTINQAKRKTNVFVTSKLTQSPTLPRSPPRQFSWSTYDTGMKWHTLSLTHAYVVSVAPKTQYCS
jgi:hypothetical protein